MGVVGSRPTSYAITLLQPKHRTEDVTLRPPFQCTPFYSEQFLCPLVVSYTDNLAFPYALLTCIVCAAIQFNKNISPAKIKHKVFMLFFRSIFFMEETGVQNTESLLISCMLIVKLLVPPYDVSVSNFRTEKTEV